MLGSRCGTCVSFIRPVFLLVERYRSANEVVEVISPTFPVYYIVPKSQTNPLILLSIAGLCISPITKQRVISLLVPGGEFELHGTIPLYSSTCENSPHYCTVRNRVIEPGLGHRSHPY